jgi:hypothetical protein
MPAVNHETVALDLNEATQTVCKPDGVKFDSLLLLVAGASPYMKKKNQQKDF